MEDTRITLRDTRNNDRSSDRAQQLGRFFLPLSSPFFDPPLEEDRSKEVAPDRISVSRTRTRRMHAIFPFLRATHTYVPRRSREDGRRERVGIGKGQVRGRVNSALIGDEGKSGDRKAVVERCRVVGNFMETRIYA